MAKKACEKISIRLGIREMEMKTMMSFSYIPIGMAETTTTKY